MPTDAELWDHVGTCTGHSKTVLSLDVQGDLIAASSKDHTARVWKVSDSPTTVTDVCVAEGHTDAVGAVALSHPKKSQTSQFFVTGAADR